MQQITLNDNEFMAGGKSERARENKQKYRTLNTDTKPTHRFVSIVSHSMVWRVLSFFFFFFCLVGWLVCRALFLFLFWRQLVEFRTRTRTRGFAIIIAIFFNSMCFLFLYAIQTLMTSTESAIKSFTLFSPFIIRMYTDRSSLFSVRLY